MNDYLLILNAGSSSIKFCIYSLPDKEDWKLVVKGQIEGIGTSPVLSVKGHEGKQMSNNRRASDRVR
jgi:acetate kinase